MAKIILVCLILVSCSTSTVKEMNLKNSGKHIENIMNKNTSSFKQCYTSNMKPNSDSGAFNLFFRISKSGKVRNQKIKMIQGKLNKSIRRCVLNLIGSISFPKVIGSDKDLEVNQPFNFYPYK